MSQGERASADTSSEPRRIREGPLTSSDGTVLHYRHRPPEEGTRARGRVLVVHGFPEHGGRYLHVLEACAARGLDAWAVDLRGFGQSGGKRGFIRAFDEYLDDVSALLAHSSSAGAETGVPVFLVGHSMGGLVSARFVEDRPAGLAGLVLSSPFFQLGLKVPPLKKVVARLASRILPGLTLPTDLDPTTLSRDPEVGKRYSEDPLIFSFATVRWFTEALAAQTLALARAPSVKLPALCMHGDADRVAHLDGTRRFFQNLGSRDKELRVWEGLRHEPFNEPEGRQVIEHVVSWIEKRVEGKDLSRA